MRNDPADAAFFEDWSRWDNIGGLVEPYAPRRGAPVWWLSLGLWSLGLGKVPSFTLCLPMHSEVHVLIKRCGGVQIVRRGTPANWHAASARHWYVHAERWRDLRSALPKIEAIATDAARAQAARYAH